MAFFPCPFEFAGLQLAYFRQRWSLRHLSSVLLPWLLPPWLLRDLATLALAILDLATLDLATWLAAHALFGSCKDLDVAVPAPLGR